MRSKELPPFLPSCNPQLSMVSFFPSREANLALVVASQTRLVVGPQVLISQKKPVWSFFSFSVYLIDLMQVVRIFSCYRQLLRLDPMQCPSFPPGMIVLSVAFFLVGVLQISSGACLLLPLTPLLLSSYEFSYSISPGCSERHPLVMLFILDFPLPLFAFNVWVLVIFTDKLLLFNRLLEIVDF